MAESNKMLLIATMLVVMCILIGAVFLGVSVLQNASGRVYDNIAENAEQYDLSPINGTNISGAAVYNLALKDVLIIDGVDAADNPLPIGTAVPAGNASIPLQIRVAMANSGPHWNLTSPSVGAIPGDRHDRYLERETEYLQVIRQRFPPAEWYNIELATVSFNRNASGDVQIALTQNDQRSGIQCVIVRRVTNTV